MIVTECARQEEYNDVRFVQKTFFARPKDGTKLYDF